MIVGYEEWAALADSTLDGDTNDGTGETRCRADIDSDTGTVKIRRVPIAFAPRNQTISGVPEYPAFIAGTA